MAAIVSTYLPVGEIFVDHPQTRSTFVSTLSTVSLSADLVSVAPDEGPLGADFDAGRWVPIVVIFRIPSDVVPMANVVMAQSGLKHVIYDGTLQSNGLAAGFSSLFADNSTISTTSDASISTVTLSMLPLGGWWSSPTVTAGGFKECS